MLGYADERTVALLNDMLHPGDLRSFAKDEVVGLNHFAGKDIRAADGLAVYRRIAHEHRALPALEAHEHRLRSCIEPSTSALNNHSRPKATINSSCAAAMQRLAISTLILLDGHGDATLALDCSGEV